MPDTLTGRISHSLSVWSVTPTTTWLIVFGGRIRTGEIKEIVSDTRVIELSEYIIHNNVHINNYSPTHITHYTQTHTYTHNNNTLIHHHLPHTHTLHLYNT